MKTLVKVVVAVGMMSAAFFSCDRKELPDEEGVIPEEFTDSLENVLFRQARAMQSLIVEDDVQVISCTMTDVEGLYEISLTSNVSFQIFVGEAAQKHESVLSYVEKEGVAYWTVSDGKGGYSDLLDSNGKNVAVASDLDFKIEGKNLVLMSGENVCALGYGTDADVQMFGCSPLLDASGEVYAVLFDLGGEKEKIVYVAEYAGVYFYLPSDESKTAITEMYAPYGATTTIGVTAFDGLDYEIVVADGWESSVRDNNGQTFLDIIAPEKAPEENAVVELTVRSSPIGG